jgi:hypothetical protein
MRNTSGNESPAPSMSHDHASTPMIPLRFTEELRIAAKEKLVVKALESVPLIVAK